MSSKNKFGFAPVEAPTSGSRRNRQPGPMGAAVRDVAENLQEATEAKIEQRRRNAEAVSYTHLTLPTNREV